MRNSQYKPGWKMGIYPTEQLIKNAILEQTLLLQHMEDDLVGAMILNNDCEPEYENVKWQIDANKTEVMVIHLLGVSHIYQGKGIAKQMVSSVIDMCRKNSIKAIRLDVLKRNIPAAKLYTSIGFQYIDSVEIFYEDTGLMDFQLYELLL
jgi:ribosomal protein S18 acetylase RimI-like enzyme